MKTIIDFYAVRAVREPPVRSMDVYRDEVGISEGLF